MIANALKARIASPIGKSPTDPQECCDWANANLLARDITDERRWVVTGDPNHPIRLDRF